MNTKKISPDDPRLTAYALGELTHEEHAAVEAALRDDPVARATVDAIRATTAQLTAALATEASPPLRAEPSLARAAIIPGRDPGKLDGGDWFDDGSKLRGNVFRFPRAYFVISGLAAACFVLLVTLRQKPPAKVMADAQESTLASVEKKSETVATPAGAGVAVGGKLADTVTNAVTPVAKDAPASQTGFIPPEALTLLGQARDTGALANAKTADSVAIVSPPPAAAAEVRKESDAAVAPAPVGSVEVQPVAARESADGAARTLPPDRNFLVSTQPASPTNAIVATEQPPAVPAEPARVATQSPAAGALTLGNNRATASDATTLDHTPVSENRGLSGFAPKFDFDKIAPRYGPGAVAKADERAHDSDNDFIGVAQRPVSSFAIDTDTAGYADVRSFLQKRQRPPREVVHIEEMLNFFPFRYSPPKGEVPFAASMEVADAPWMPSHRLVRIGLKAREVQEAARPPMILMFVIDVVDVERLSSRLPLIRGAILSLLEKLQPRDRVGIVSCRNQSALVLKPTPVANSREIVAALESLEPGGATSRMKGLQLAYGTVEANAATGDNSRVILCTDGNAELTITAEGPFAKFLAARKKSGVAFTAFGFGMGIYHDSLIDFVAEYGSGNWAYIDSRRDAEKLLAEDVNGPPVTVAKDVTVEVAFNPAKVASYRLIGYDNHALKKDDFKGDTFDTDEIGAGHAVTALFEIEPVRSATATAAGSVAPAFDPNELLSMKVRYKKPGGALKRMLDFPLFDSRTRFVDASADFKFAAAVAGLGMILRDSPHKGATTLTQVIEWAESAAAAGGDPGGYRSEFVELAREAEKIDR